VPGRQLAALWAAFSGTITPFDSLRQDGRPRIVQTLVDPRFEPRRADKRCLRSARRWTCLSTIHAARQSPEPRHPQRKLQHGGMQNGLATVFDCEAASCA
jgi:hypothetical protein